MGEDCKQEGISCWMLLVMGDRGKQACTFARHLQTSMGTKAATALEFDDTISEFDTSVLESRHFKSNKWFDLRNGTLICFQENKGTDEDISMQLLSRRKFTAEEGVPSVIKCWGLDLGKKLAASVRAKKGIVLAVVGSVKDAASCLEADFVVPVNEDTKVVQLAVCLGHLLRTSDLRPDTAEAERKLVFQSAKAVIDLVHSGV